MVHMLVLLMPIISMTVRESPSITSYTFYFPTLSCATSQKELRPRTGLESEQAYVDTPVNDKEV